MASGTKSTARLARTAACLACLSALNAHASYTVIEDDLLPTAVVAARQAAATSQQHDIPFAKNSANLGPLGRRTIDQLIETSGGASIKVIGRPDASPDTSVVAADNSGRIPIAAARTTALRNYLLLKGIPLSRITAVSDNTPNPQTNGSIYPSHIVIEQDAPRPSPQPRQVRPQLSEAPAASAILAAAPDADLDRERLIRLINQSVQAGTMDATVALTLMSRLLAGAPGDINSNATAPAANPVRNVQAPPPVPVAAPPVAPKEKWELDKDLNLRDNMIAWSKKAGWNPTQWDATNVYQVVSSTTVVGDFPDVLRQIADSTGLNICANKTKQVVRVTDAGVACDKDR